MALGYSYPAAARSLPSKPPFRRILLSENALQYFGDAIASMSDIRRVLIPGGTALLVLQDSYYKELHVDLPALFLATSPLARLSDHGTSDRGRPSGDDEHKHCVRKCLP